MSGQSTPSGPARLQAQNDAVVLELLACGRLRVNFGTGEVFSTRSNTPEKPLGSPTPKGYLRVCLNVGGGQVTVMIHRIVWVAAYGLPGPGTPQVNHKDTVKSHNWLSNLELMTNRANMRHAAEHGCLKGPRGERAPRGKLKESDVLTIRRLAAQGVKTRDLAVRFGVATSNVRQIVRRSSWSWLADEPSLYVRGDAVPLPYPPEGGPTP